MEKWRKIASIHPFLQYACKYVHIGIGSLISVKVFLLYIRSDFKHLSCKKNHVVNRGSWGFFFFENSIFYSFYLKHMFCQKKKLIKISPLRQANSLLKQTAGQHRKRKSLLFLQFGRKHSMRRFIYLLFILLFELKEDKQNY